MSLGMEVGLDPNDIVLDGGPDVPFQKGGRAPDCRAPDYRPMSIVLDGDPAPPPTRRCAYRRATSQSRDAARAVERDIDPAPPPKKGAQAPHFRPMSIMAKQLDGSR